jgi:hypothetical protein
MKFENAKIYKIICSETNRIYYGSTTQKLNHRLNHHTAKRKSGRNCLTRDFVEPKIYLVELVECDNKKDLLLRENYYIDNFECVNKKRAFRSKEDKKQYNKEYLKVRKQKYHLTNNETIECECGTIVKKVSYKHHLTTNKHKKLLEKNI